MSKIEDFNKMRLIVRSLVQMDFQKQWQFRLDIQDTTSLPNDFDFFVKDISYSRGELTTDETQIGSTSFAWPTGEEVKKISATMRDHEDARISTYMEAWKKEVVHDDGTVGLPFDGPNGKGYLRKVKIYRLYADGTETLESEWQMYPQSLGEVVKSVENGEFFEFPLVIIQHSTLPTR